MSERILIRDAKLGDKKALEELIDKYTYLINSIAKKYTRNHNDLMDNINYAVEFFIVAVNRYEGKKEFKEYVTGRIEDGFTFNLYKNSVTKEYAILDSEEFEYLKEPVFKDEDFDGKIIDNERKEILLNSLANLSHKELLIIKLRFGIDCDVMSQKEIASNLGIHQGLVSRLEKMAFKKLKSAFNYEYDNSYSIYRK